MKCGRCGAESVWERYFERRAWGFGGRGMVCPGCRHRLAEVEWRGAVRFVAGLALVCALVSLLGGGRLPRSFVLVPALFALILAHELAHAIAGRLVGLHIHTIRVGDGRVVVRFRLGGARIELGSLFFAGGYCAVSHPGEPARWRIAVGVGAPLVMHAALIPVSIAGGWGWPLIALNAMLLVVNAYPKTFDDGLQSDGRHLLSLWRDEDERGGWRWNHLVCPIQQALLDGRAEEAFRSAERAVAHYPDDDVIREFYVEAARRAGRYDSALEAAGRITDGRLLQTRVLADMGRFEDAEAELEGAACDASNDEERVHLEAATALIRLLDGRPADPDAAYARLPWVPDVQHAQAAAALEADRPEVAERVLQKVAVGSQLIGAEGTRAAFEAAALAALGQSARARQRLDRARADQAEPYAIHYAEQWLDRSSD